MKLIELYRDGHLLKILNGEKITHIETRIYNTKNAVVLYVGLDSSAEPYIKFTVATDTELDEYCKGLAEELKEDLLKEIKTNILRYVRDTLQRSRIIDLTILKRIALS